MPYWSTVPVTVVTPNFWPVGMTLGQLRGAVEAVPLAPLDRTVVVGGEGLALGELGVDHLGARVFEQLGVVEALELGREGIRGVEGARHAGGGVDEARGAVDEAARVGEKLEVNAVGGVGFGHVLVSFWLHNFVYIVWWLPVGERQGRVSIELGSLVQRELARSD